MKYVKLQSLSIFHTNVKYGDKSYKLIIDNGSERNVISSRGVVRLGLKTEPIPKPFRVAWIEISPFLSLNSVAYLFISVILRKMFSVLSFRWTCIIFSQDVHGFTIMMSSYMDGQIIMCLSMREKQSIYVQPCLSPKEKKLPTQRVFPLSPPNFNF